MPTFIYFVLFERIACMCALALSQVLFHSQSLSLLLSRSVALTCFVFLQFALPDSVYFSYTVSFREIQTERRRAQFHFSFVYAIRAHFNQPHFSKVNFFVRTHSYTHFQRDVIFQFVWAITQMRSTTLATQIIHHTHTLATNERTNANEYGKNEQQTIASK